MSSMDSTPIVGGALVITSAPGESLKAFLQSDGERTEIAHMPPLTPSYEPGLTQQAQEEHFVWLIQSAANFHNLPVVKETEMPDPDDTIEDEERNA